MTEQTRHRTVKVKEIAVYKPERLMHCYLQWHILCQNAACAGVKHDWTPSTPQLSAEPQKCCISHNIGERESRPFLEEPDALNHWFPFSSSTQFCTWTFLHCTLGTGQGFSTCRSLTILRQKESIYRQEKRHRNSF